MLQSAPKRFFKRATLPLKQYKYSYIFIVVKRFILNVSGLFLRTEKTGLPAYPVRAHFSTLTPALCCESITEVTSRTKHGQD